MSDTDWRTWAYQRLKIDVPLAALLPQLPDGDEAIYGAGSITDPPSVHPFIILKMEPEVPGPFPGVSAARIGVHAHDEPGDYVRIGSVLQAARSALVGSGGQVVALGAVACVWRGTSADLSDPDLGTIFRTITFDLYGKDGNA